METVVWRYVIWIFYDLSCVLKSESHVLCDDSPILGYFLLFFLSLYQSSVNVKSWIQLSLCKGRLTLTERIVEFNFQVLNVCQIYSFLLVPDYDLQ